LLSGSEYAADANINNVLKRAYENMGPDTFGYRADFIQQSVRLEQAKEDLETASENLSAGRYKAAKRTACRFFSGEIILEPPVLIPARCFYDNNQKS